MRMLMRVSIPVETGNAAAKAGTLGSLVEGILADLKPETAYWFADDDGQRSGDIVFDMKDTSQNSRRRRAVVSRLQSQGLVSASHEHAGSCQGGPIDRRSRTEIRQVGTPTRDGSPSRVSVHLPIGACKMRAAAVDEIVRKCFSSADYKEGRIAFLGKCKPVFKRE